MTFDEDERASSLPPTPVRPAAGPPASTPPSPQQSTPAPTSPLGEGPSQPPTLSPATPASRVSLAERVAVIEAQVDALAAVSPRDLDGAGA